MFNPDPIIIEVVGQVSGYFSHLLTQLFMGGAEVSPALAQGQPWQAAIYEISPLAQTIRDLCAYANGESNDEPALVAETIQSICETLFVAPGGAYSYEIPSTFWHTALGQLVLACRLRMNGDTLITISTAAELVYGENTQPNRMKIQRAIDRGDLTRYTATDEPNPQRSRRLSRAEVEAYRDGLQ